MEAASTTSSGASSVDGRSVGGSSDFLNMFPGNSGDLFLGNGLDNAGTSFDLNDFPSLGGGAGASQGNGLAAALRQQQLMAQQQQQQQQQQMLGSNSKGSNLYRLAMTGTNGNFNMASEDFPALPGAPAPGSGAPSLLGSGSVARTGSGGLYGDLGDNGTSQLDAGTGLLGGVGIGGLRGLQPGGGAAVTRSPAPAGAIGSSTTAASGPSGSAAGTALNGDYGLLGLLGVIRMTDSDRNSLALGSGINLLTLNLGTTEQIYSTMTSPFNGNQTTKEPHFQLPACYNMQPPALKTGHLSKFQLETLFYIFYALPKDVLQAYAAQELYAREWRYHGEHKLWFKRAGPSDGVANNSGGSPQYLYFDINSWERRVFTSNMQNITSGFLPEEEVRVKFPNS